MQTPVQDPRIVYGDILTHPHHRSKTRAQMSLYERAAQFSSFDALAGFSDMIAEEARLTETEHCLGEDAQELLNRELLGIESELTAGRSPRVRFTVFVPDERKAGGSTVQLCDTVRQVDTAERCVVLKSRTRPGGEYKRLAFERILAVFLEEEQP